MSVQVYADSKIIDEVTFLKSEKGTARAYLHAKNGVSEDVLANIISELQKKEWQAIPYTLDGKPVLEVRGFSSQAKLNKLLHERDWVDGNPRIKQLPADNITFKEKVKKRSLQAAGVLYAWGDASFIAYGWKGKSPLDVAAGVFYGLPTPVLMAYGKNDQSNLQIKDAARQMANYLKQEGMNLPESCSLESIAQDRKKGLIKSTDDLFRRYPSEFMNLCYATAGACIYAAGKKHLKANHVEPKAIGEWYEAMSKAQPGTLYATAKTAAVKSMRTENYFNLGVGATTLSSGVFGAVVKEKAHDPDEPKKTGIAGVWDWVKERPLTITGAGLMVSTMLHAVSTTVAMRGHDSKHKESVWWRASFVVSALMAELMVAISSKGHGEGVVSDNSVDNSIISIAADLIVKQPDHRQDYLIEHIGNFLGRPEVLAMDTKAVIDRLRHEVETMRRNPWAIPLCNDAPQAVTQSNKEQKKPEEWKARITQPVTTESQPHIGS